ncbi:MAG: dimethylarginine dimethylaminohydrolase family protein [Actinomycetota bacterium]
MSTSIVRPPGDSFRHAVSRHPQRYLIEPSRARAQHAAYLAALESLGASLVVLPPDEGHPDACFTQDPAIVLEGRALIGRAGVASRAAEAQGLLPVLAGLVEGMVQLAPPATLEGGDVLRIGRRVLVGRSKRTNDAGIEQLRLFCVPLGLSVHPVEVPEGVLHLSTAATSPGSRLVIGLPQVIADDAFAGMHKIPVEIECLPACNVLTVGDTVIASGDYPEHHHLEAAGFTVVRLDLLEFVRADAGPTCLSLVVG